LTVYLECTRGFSSQNDDRFITMYTASHCRIIYFLQSRVCQTLTPLNFSGDHQKSDALWVY